MNHPELASANVFLTGFSAGGYLSVSIAAQFPNRVLGTIPYAPASAYFDLDDLAVPPALANVPSLILVSSTDVLAGDQRPLFLFQRGWVQGAPWGFASQHFRNHCCVDSVAPILNLWVPAIVNNFTTGGANGLFVPQPPSRPVAPTVAFQPVVDGNFDPFGWQDFYFATASILPSPTAGPYTAWMPDQGSAQAWITWVTNPDGN